MTKEKVYLMILDGFGEGKDYPGNAEKLAHMKNLEELKSKYPWTLLQASGNAVGLPENTQGGSEVGHFTIGAGRIVFQSLEEINRSIHDGSFFLMPSLVEAMEKVKNTPQTALHLLGMISDSGIHSHLNHLFALLYMAKTFHVGPVYIHAITDGRDVPEKTAKLFIEQIQKKIVELGFSTNPNDIENYAGIATIVGRFTLWIEIPTGIGPKKLMISTHRQLGQKKPIHWRQSITPMPEILKQTITLTQLF